MTIKFVYDENENIARSGAAAPDVIYLGPGFARLERRLQVKVLNHYAMHRRLMKKVHKPVPPKPGVLSTLAYPEKYTVEVSR